MGVTASMSISLIRDKNLWINNVIIIHLSMWAMKCVLLASFLGQVMSLELATKEENEDLDYKIKLKSIQSKFVEYISQEENFVNGLVKYKSCWT